MSIYDDGPGFLESARREAYAIKLIERMLEGASLRRAALDENVAYGTAKAIFGEERFRTMLRIALEGLREGMVERARMRLEVAVDGAVDALIEVVEGEARGPDGDIPKPRDRVVAASALLDRVGIFPRRVIEHRSIVDGVNDDELINRLLPEALRVLQVDAIDVTPRPSEAKTIEQAVQLSPPRKASGKVARKPPAKPKKPTSKKPTKKKRTQ